MVDQDQIAFEGWTHDAPILPMSAYPFWRHKFLSDAQSLERKWRIGHREDCLTQTGKVLDQIGRDGPVGSGDVRENENKLLAGGRIGIPPNLP